MKSEGMLVVKFIEIDRQQLLTCLVLKNHTGLMLFWLLWLLESPLTTRKKIFSGIAMKRSH